MINKEVRKGVALFSLALLGLPVGVSTAQVALTPVMAHAVRPTSSGLPEPYNPKDPASWWQNKPYQEGLPRPKKGSPDKNYGRADSALNALFPDGSCMIFSLTFVLLKAGAVPQGTSAADIHDLTYDAVKQYGYCEYTALDSKEHLKGVLELADAKFAGGTRAEAVEAWNRGELVILHVQGPGYTHAVAIDKIEGNEIYILDSGNWGQKLSDFPSYGNTCIGYVSFKFTDGKTKAKDTPVLQDHPDGNWGSSTPSKSDNEGSLTSEMQAFHGGGGAWTPDEEAIPNMPSYREWLEYSSAIGSSEDNYYNFVQRLKNEEGFEEDFGKGTDGANSIAKWKEENAFRADKESIKQVRVLNQTVALLLVMLTAPFIALVCADLFNPLGVSLLAVLSGGRLRVMSSEESKHYKKGQLKTSEGKCVRVITPITAVVWVAVVSLFAVLMLNGYLYLFFQWFVDVITAVVGNFG